MDDQDHRADATGAPPEAPTFEPPPAPGAGSGPAPGGSAANTALREEAAAPPPGGGGGALGVKFQGGPRPWPRLPSILAAVGGLLALGSLAIFLSELPERHPRYPGLLVSLLFVAIGVAALLLLRNRPAATAGVVVSAVALVPLLIFAFIDPKRPEPAFSSLQKGKTTVTLILLLAGLAWVAAYLFGPGRGAAFYLGAALLALWGVLLVQIATPSPSRYRSSTEFDPSSGGSGFDPFAPLRSAVKDTATRAGLVSLIVGLLYLVLAARLDRRGDGRPATPLFATAALVLTVGVLALGNQLKVQGASLLGIALGAVTMLLGTRAGRRFTSWYGGLAVAVGFLALLIRVTDGPNKTSGVLVLLVGVGLAVLGDRLTDRFTDARDAWMSSSDVNQVSRPEPPSGTLTPF